MMSLKKALLACGLLGCLGGVCWSLSSVAAPVEKPAPAGASMPGGFAGNVGCSARNCHGGDAPIKDDKVVALQNEYTHVVMYDKHAQAYDVLTKPRARLIEENLAAGGTIIPAHEDERCLACHATPESAKGVKPGAVSASLRNLHTGGVTCEACHGPSMGKKPWINVHTSEKDWRKLLDPAKKQKDFGFTDLSTPAKVAQVCVGCHVGAPETATTPVRDCNHDIMAAGHPRLNFELGSYIENMPPHWNTKLKKEDPARVWLDGRVVSAKAALDQLADRATRAGEKKAPWPELAEYRCYSCHTDLNNNWKWFRNDGNRPRGTLPYDSWYSSLLPLADPSLAAGYDKLTLAMTLDKPGDVAEQAKALSKSLEGLLARDAAQVLKDIAAKADPEKMPRTWEDAAQLVLAVVAARKADLRASPEKVEKVLKALGFPTGTHADGKKWNGEGPKGAEGPAIDQTSFLTDLKALLGK